MKSVRRLAAVLALLLSAPMVAHAAGARVIVKYKADSELLRKQALAAGQEPAVRAQALGQRVGVTLAAGHALGERSQVVFASGMTSEALAARLAQEGDVEYAVPDRRKRIVAAPNDPRYLTVALPVGPVSGQWYLRAPAGEVRSAINAEAAWDTTTGDPGIVVAVVDTGIRRDHPDLTDNLLNGYDMISPDAPGDFSTANDGSGRDADPSDPGDWLDQADIDSGDFAPCTADDIAPSSWHGTEVSGIVAALTNNSVGMASVGRNVKVLPVRALGKCGGFDSDIVAGMRWAAGLSTGDPNVPPNPNPAKVINLSLGGGSGCSDLYRDAVAAITAQGVTIVASAGNSAGHVVSEPAACAGVIGVAGLRHVGSKVGFSDIGPEVGISAPGGNCVNLTGNCLYPILTTSNSGTTTPVTGAAGAIYTDGSSRLTLGTSFSAPLVAGTAALMYSVRPTLTPAQTRQLIQSTARVFPTAAVLGAAAPEECTAPQFDLDGDPVDQIECVCSTGTCGTGMLDAGAAVLAANAGTLALSSRARIDVPAQAFRATLAIPLDGSDSEAASGRTITQYRWTLLDGGGIVTAIAGATNSAASVTPSAPGRFKVRLTVTDSAAATATADLSIVVLEAPVQPPPSSGGGGGSLSAAWLLLLGLALLALRRAPRPARTRPH